MPAKVALNIGQYFLYTHLVCFSRHSVLDIVIARILYLIAHARVLLMIERGLYVIARGPRHLVTRPGPLPLPLKQSLLEAVRNHPGAEGPDHSVGSASTGASHTTEVPSHTAQCKGHPTEMALIFQGPLGGNSFSNATDIQRIPSTTSAPKCKLASLPSSCFRQPHLFQHSTPHAFVVFRLPSHISLPRQRVPGMQPRPVGVLLSPCSLQVPYPCSLSGSV